MFLKTFLGAMISCVISHTAYAPVSRRLMVVGSNGVNAYCLEIHRSKLEQSPEEWR